MLQALAGTFRDVQQLRIAAGQRAIGPAFIDAFEDLEYRLGVAVRKELRRHLLWPWLSEHPGLGGVQTATLLARIGDPRRFPGQPCSLGHISPPGAALGVPCPAVGAEDEPCPGVMLEMRRGTGVRALWHYCGLHVVDGHAPRRKKGLRSDWDPKARAALLMPKGIADQIVIHGLEPWRSIYDAVKARKLAGSTAALDPTSGEPVDVHRAVHVTNGELADSPDDALSLADPPKYGLGSGRSVAGPPAEPADVGVAPIRAHAIARTVAVKAFVGDLLIAWKALAAGSAHGDS